MLINTLNTFISGDTIRFITTFEVKDVLTDPRIVRFRIKNPNQSVEIKTYDEDEDGQEDIRRDAAGEYHVNLKVDIPGTWWYRWEGTNPAPGAIEGRFKVLASNIVG